MKKLLSALLVLVSLLVFASAPAMAADIALVTDVGTIDDESFNQACWQGVEAFAKANNLSYQYYQPAADSDDERLGSIDQAASDGAKVIVMPGFLFNAAAGIAQELYPDVKFIAIDVNAADIGAEQMENLYCAIFGEEQAEKCISFYGDNAESMLEDLMPYILRRIAPMAAKVSAQRRKELEKQARRNARRRK